MEENDTENSEIFQLQSCKSLTRMCFEYVAQNLDLFDPESMRTVIPYPIRARLYTVLAKKNVLPNSPHLLTEQEKERLCEIMDCLIGYDQKSFDFSISFKGVPNEVVSLLGRCKHLTSLNLAHCLLVDETSMSIVAKNCTAITYLNITELKSVNIFHLVNSKNYLPNIRIVKASKSSVPCLESVIKLLRNRPYLEHVDLSNCDILFPETQSREYISIDPFIAHSLKYFDITNIVQPSEKSMFQLFFEKVSFPQLETLLISRVVVDEKNPLTVAQFQPLPSLKTLDLSQCFVSSNIMWDLSEISPNLTSLSIIGVHNDFNGGAHSLRFLQNLSVRSSLQSLFTSVFNPFNRNLTDLFVMIDYNGGVQFEEDFWELFSLLETVSPVVQLEKLKQVTISSKVAKALPRDVIQLMIQACPNLHTIYFNMPYTSAAWGQNFLTSAFERKINVKYGYC